MAYWCPMNLWQWTPRRIYLDYAAATPVRKEVVKAMSPYLDGIYGNPGSIHAEGVKAKEALEEARDRVGRALRARPTDVIFTSGGTESNNLALKGSVLSMLRSGVAPRDIEILATKIEHPSIMKTLEALEEDGVVVTYLPIDEDGRVMEASLKQSLSPKTRLITVAYANSETGVTQDLGRLGRIVRAYERENGLTILFHTDAAQAPLWLPCALDALNVDMMTLDGGKCEGPKGVGALVARPRAKLAAITFGGSQERALRPGTEPVELVVGFSVALELAQKEWQWKSNKVKELRDRFIGELEAIPDLVLNGSREHRLPNNVNISVSGLDTEFAVIVLDQHGIACGTRSACSGAGGGRSHVVYEMTGDHERASSTIRFSLGPNTTWSDLKKTIKVFKRHLEQTVSFKDSLRSN